MPVDYQDILQVIQQLSENRHIKVTVKESIKGAGLVAGSAFAGSILGGPVGLVIGSIIGTGFAYGRSQGKYLSVPYIIQNEMTLEEKNRLAESVHRVVSNVDATDSVMLLSIIMSNSSLETLVMREIMSFLTQNGYSIMSG